MMKVLSALIIAGILIFVPQFMAFATVDAPHNESNNINCGSCHGQGLLQSPFWGGSLTFDELCQNCHTASSGPYTATNAPLVKTHSSENTSEQYGVWSWECRDCHDPHYQKQKNYKSTDSDNLYLATGTIINCVDNGNGTSTLTYSSIIYKTGWNATKLLKKTGEYRRAILLPNVGKLGYSYPVIGIDGGAQEITVSGDATPVYQYISTSTFAMTYGQYIKDTLENKTVKFFDRKGTNSFSDGGEIYNGVCEVCHTQTIYHRNDGLGAPHYPAVRCTICHLHIDGFADSDHTGSSGEDCDDCHGKDADNGGYGTTISHSTHMENDADDLKGPHIECYDCHNINNFPEFVDGEYTLASTTVCDNCHSPGGGYNGVAMAKANWDAGIYESDGVTLRSGNDLWCATCHDEDPAFSTSQLYEIIVDDPDATYGGSWTTGSNTDQYGDSVRWKQIPAIPDGTATWRPNITYAGQYSVYAWWTVHSNRATDAPYTIYYDGGSQEVRVNQEINGGKWNYLGTYPFAEGTNGYVVLSDDSAETGQYVIADAVKFEIGPQGIFAPKVIGDNSTYGYYVTGHGANDLVQCLHCHDASVTHIDHEARTYDAGVNSYCDSYRIKEIYGQPGMEVPRSSGGALANWRDFALCFECHDRYAVIGASSDDVSKTNFWDADAAPNNSHWYHLGMTKVYDSDYDGTTDSAPSCVTCHNVHGSPTGPMIRHGELISPYGTTSYAPSFNFYYLIAGDGSATATFTPTLPGGTYNVYAWWSTHTNRATNAKYLIDHDGGQDPVVVNQEINGGQWNLLGTYSITTASGSVTLTSEGANEYIMADAIGWDRDGVFTDDWNCDGILDPEVLVDDPDATYTGAWTHANNTSYGTYQRDSTDDGDSVTWTPNIPSNDTYSVYAWWRADTNRATDAPYTITYDGGYETVYKNQRQDGGTWNLLGTYPFASGTSGSVQLDETTTGRINADAIGWDTSSDPNNFINDWNCDGVKDPAIVIDDPGASFTGSWTTYAPDARYKVSTSYHYAPTWDANASTIDSVGGTMQSGGLNSNHSCGTCHTGVTWVRSQVYTGPKILNKESDQETIQLGETCTEVLLTAVVLDADNNIDTVVIDLTTLNGDPAQTMYDDSTHGDVTAGDGIYSYLATVCLDAGSGTKTLTVTATDGDSQSVQGQIIVEAVAPGEIVWDNGGADSNWSTPENWNPDGVPGPGDRVAFNNLSSADCVVDVSTIDVDALSMNYGYTGTVTLSAASMGSNELIITGDLTVNSGTLLCVGDTTAINEASGGSVGNPHGEGIIINAPNITVGISGTISADGQGFLSNEGPGAGNFSHDQGAGGSYGGIGGEGIASVHGPTYGSLSEPTALGSAGAYNYSGVDTYGGTGAGAIKLVVSNTLTNNGTISADGDRYILGHAGGGAGGSIWIITNILEGSGSITADGGFGHVSEGGGGAGGRIALEWNTRTFDGIIRAKGGSGWQAGHHGTIWVPSGKWNELWNGTDHVNGSIALAAGDYSIAELHLDSGVTLECQADNDGDPVEGSGVTITATNINIPDTAAISVSGLGFITNEGPGVGGFSHDQGAGGSHGGIGGDGVASVHGPTYGSVSEPISIGSGGAYNYSGLQIGGTGAGAIKLIVSNTLTVDGTVSANGDRYFGGHAGGGAGGSIWIVASTLAGSGSIIADGGIGQSTEGGGGAGGRIALEWNSRSFDGIIRAKGGTGWQAGHHGTVWVPSDNWNELWSATYHVNGSVALAPGDYSIAELHLDSDVTLECQADNDGNPVEGSGVTITATNIDIPETAAISADGLGFITNEGPGVGGFSHDQGAGGSHGGIGGDGVASGHGPTYGSVSAPTSIGSGGAYSYGGLQIGGSGAGAIKLIVSNTLTVDGTVSANGDRYFGGHAGGGAGGSIWIITDILEGSGSIIADGGIGEITEGGGGAGGRIALEWTTRTFDGIIRAKGGTGWQAGHNGTLWVPSMPSNKWNELWSATYHVNGSVALAPGDYSISELHLDSGVTLECQADNDGDPVEGSGVTITATNIDIPETAAISADGLGFITNEGPGAGGYSNNQGAGGSHGGTGGDCVGASAGPTYGSDIAPTSIGSGGSYNYGGIDNLGGTGAGAIKLVVSNTLTVDGTISVNGDRYFGGQAGGGAGGSIWIITDVLDGSGSISADGGIGQATEGGGGGGGRVAVYYNTDSSSLSGSTTVSGGTGWDNGEPGTIIW